MPYRPRELVTRMLLSTISGKSTCVAPADERWSHLSCLATAKSSGPNRTVNNTSASVSSARRCSRLCARTTSASGNSLWSCCAAAGGKPGKPLSPEEPANEIQTLVIVFLLRRDYLSHDCEMREKNWLMP